MQIDPVYLTAQLIRCPSVTPNEAGAIKLLEDMLSQYGFHCKRISRGGVENLFARWGSSNKGPSFAFNGHTDVVPVGELGKWTFDPFGAEIENGFMYGRGAVDMKSAVAAFVAAAVDFVNETPPEGSVVITVTGDEEGDADHGTVAILDWMSEQGERIDHCLVGEPTCPDRLGEMIKVGRRGSMTAMISAIGVQGHSAYPHRAKNPLPALAKLIDRLANHELDKGTEHFDPSTLAVTSIDTGNRANNVIPAKAKAVVNIRFNDAFSSDELGVWLQKEAERINAETDIEMSVEIKVSGESFLTPPGELSSLVGRVIEDELGIIPIMSTTGGTSDARFVKTVCPVIEFGLVGKSMHSVDERVDISQIGQLKTIYKRVLRDYFAS
ncbi:MAG: succinyl-diaminopimelate desuccinylase [Paracoccaceae bacterium]|nr:succinyl-diaminopimelate desuccinylase [Paracoccaceae bacterium]